MSRLFRSLQQFNDWLRGTHSTNLTIVVGLYLASVFVHSCLIADMLDRPISDGTQLTLSLFISAMLGVGVTQFTMKRKTDDAYMRAKAGLEPPPPRPSTAVPVQGDNAQ